MSRNGDKLAREFGPKYSTNHRHLAAQKETAVRHPRARQREQRPVDAHNLTARHVGKVGMNCQIPTNCLLFL